MTMVRRHWKRQIILITTIIASTWSYFYIHQSYQQHSPVVIVVKKKHNDNNNNNNNVSYSPFSWNQTDFFLNHHHHHDEFKPVLLPSSAGITSISDDDESPADASLSYAEFRTLVEKISLDKQQQQQQQQQQRTQRWNIAIVSTCIIDDDDNDGNNNENDNHDEPNDLFCQLTRYNHESYAKKFHYDYLSLSRNPLPAIISPNNKHLTKYLLLARALTMGNYDWILYLDSDAVITNYDVSIASFLNERLTTISTTTRDDIKMIISHHNKKRSVAAGTIVDHSVTLLKNDEWSLHYLYRIVSSRYAFKTYVVDDDDERDTTSLDGAVATSVLIALGEYDATRDGRDDGDGGGGLSRTAMGRRVIAVEMREEGRYWRGYYPTATGDYISRVSLSSSGRDKYSHVINRLMELNLPVPSPRDRFRFFREERERRDGPAGTCRCHSMEGEGSDVSGGGAVASLSCIPRYHVIGVHKAGTKALLWFLGQHERLLGPFKEDMVRWLTDTMTKKTKSICSQLAKKNQKKGQPSYLTKGTTGTIHTCSYHDYGRLYGNTLLSSINLTSTNNSRRTCPQILHSFTKPTPPPPPHLEKAPLPILFDEWVIWDATFLAIRGVPLPHVVKMMQPSSKLIVTVRDPVAVVYSAYHHFGPSFLRSDTSSPRHFDDVVRNVTMHWYRNGCRPDNYRTCLSSTATSDDDGDGISGRRDDSRHHRAVTIIGSWFARGAYARYLVRWMEEESYDCDSLFVYDTSVVDAAAEGRRLLQFMGVSSSSSDDDDDGDDDELDGGDGDSTRRYGNGRSGGGNLTAIIDEMKRNETVVKGYGELRNQNPMNKALYEPMLDETKERLELFFSPYNKELCELITKYSCLDTPLFRSLCNGGRR